MARLLGREDLVSVTADQGKAAVPIEDQGAGGTGTSRVWLDLQFEGAVAPESVFVKLPAPSLFERMMLTVFGVYRNELRFYGAIADLPHAPHHLFCRLRCVRSEGTRFVLVLEDLGAHGCHFPSITGTYTLCQAKVWIQPCTAIPAS